MDQYYGETGSSGNQLCDFSDFADLTTWEQNTRHSYTAAVFSDAGLEAAETAQAEKNHYTRLNFAADMTITGNKRLSAFGDYRVVSAQGKEGDVPTTLTVADGATLTIAPGCYLSFDSGWDCKIVVESGGKLVTERDGLDGDCGRVNILSRRGFENHGTVENNGQFTVVYDGDGNGNLDHAGTLVGLPDNCLKEAWVYSYADLKAAVENEYDEILVSENEVTVSGDLTIPKDIELYIEPSASLIVEENCTLQTDCYQIANDATITVYGTLQLGKTCKLHNFGTLEIGQLTGDAVSRVVALADGDQRAYIFNDGNIQIYGTGDLDLTNGDYAPYGWDNGIRYAKGNINDWSKVKLPAGMQRKAL